MNHAWMPFYVADYLADTGHLTAVEHGAYLLLILHYWQHQGLPDDDKKLARIARLSGAEWQESRETLADLFLPGWRHKRIEEELARADDIIAKCKAAGTAGASARYGKRMPEPSQTDAPLPSPSPKKDSSFREEIKNGSHVDTSALLAEATRSVKRASAEKSNYMWLKATDTRRPNAEAWWQAHYGTPMPWESNKHGLVCRVPWEAVRYAIPPPAGPVPPREAAA